jgi:phage FluMu protein gp41
MKTYCPLFLLGFLTIPTQVLAQLPTTGAKPVKTGNEWRMPSDALPRSQQFTDELTKTLNLDEATAKKVFTAYLANTKSVDEIRMGGGSEKEITSALLTNQIAFETTLKGILSPAQFEKFTRDRVNNKDRIKPRQ